MIQFEVTEDHLKLIKSINFDITRGQIIQDSKRPFGNSDMHEDAAKILGLTLFEDSYGEFHLSKDQKLFIDKLLSELPKAHSIITSNLPDSVLGMYKKEKEYIEKSYIKI